MIPLLHFILSFLPSSLILPFFLLSHLSFIPSPLSLLSSFLLRFPPPSFSFILSSSCLTFLPFPFLPSLLYPFLSFIPPYFLPSCFLPQCLPVIFLSPSILPSFLPSFHFLLVCLFPPTAFLLQLFFLSFFLSPFPYLLLAPPLTVSPVHVSFILPTVFPLPFSFLPLRLRPVFPFLHNLRYSQTRDLLQHWWKRNASRKAIKLREMK